MKNIYILPTDKPSRLWKTWELNLELHPTITESLLDKQHIYITSDEKIKRGDWYIADNKVYKASVDHMPELYTYSCKKIILTTDDQLIKDGIQPIDDEFLEWFVKNPSCESVEIIPLRKSSGWYDEKEIWHWNFLAYKIIIPKEEPKQETVGEAAKRIALETYSEIFSKYPRGGKLSNETIIGILTVFFRLGSEWQQERMYSEDDMHNLMDEYQEWLVLTLEPVKPFKEWFEKHKKK